MRASHKAILVAETRLARVVRNGSASKIYTSLMNGHSILAKCAGHDIGTGHMDASNNGV